MGAQQKNRLRMSFVGCGEGPSLAAPVPGTRCPAGGTTPVWAAAVLVCVAETPRRVVKELQPNARLKLCDTSPKSASPGTRAVAGSCESRGARGGLVSWLSRGL